jgi:hypothetical protein
MERQAGKATSLECEGADKLRRLLRKEKVSPWGRALLSMDRKNNARRKNAATKLDSVTNPEQTVGFTATFRTLIMQGHASRMEMDTA